MKFTFCVGSSSFDGSSSGRSPTRSDCSATRAARFADFTELNFAAARTSVPPALAIAEIVTQSATARVYDGCPLGPCPGYRRWDRRWDRAWDRARL